MTTAFITGCIVLVVLIVLSRLIGITLPVVDAAERRCIVLANGSRL